MPLRPKNSKVAFAKGPTYGRGQRAILQKIIIDEVNSKAEIWYVLTFTVRIA